MKMLYGTIETPEGEVLRLDTRTLTSDNEIRVYGDAIKGQMNLVMEGTRQRQEKTIPWNKDIRGPYAAEQSMARKPMEEDESRSLKMYIPDLNRVVEVTLKAGRDRGDSPGGRVEAAAPQGGPDRFARRQTPTGAGHDAVG